jgi:hypothetical protein
MGAESVAKERVVRENCANPQNDQDFEGAYLLEFSRKGVGWAALHIHIRM